MLSQPSRVLVSLQRAAMRNAGLVGAACARGWSRADGHTMSNTCLIFTMWPRFLAALGCYRFFLSGCFGLGVDLLKRFFWLLN